MPCEECLDLRTHRFASRTDLVNALRVAAEEVDRGVLVPVVVVDRTIAEQVAIGSALQAGALPDVVLYRFKCTICADDFELSADTDQGNGEWRRNGEHATSGKAC
jgi:hypothetical protein